MCSQSCWSLQWVGSFGSCHLSGPDRALTWYKQAVVATVVTFLKHRRDDGTFPRVRALPRNRAQRKGWSPWHVYRCLYLLANFSALSHCSSSYLPYSPKEKNLPPFLKVWNCDEPSEIFINAYTRQASQDYLYFFLASSDRLPPEGRQSYFATR